MSTVARCEQLQQSDLGLLRAFAPDPQDMWALGCVLFELCALRVPFASRDRHLLAVQIVVGDLPQFPSEYSEARQAESGSS